MCWRVLYKETKHLIKKENKMKVKNGAVLAGLSIEMTVAMRIVDDICKKYNQESIISCGLNGVHMAGSLHYSGNALDFSIHHIPKDVLTTILKELYISLQKISINYGICLHSTHLHVQFKPDWYSKVYK